MPSPSSNRGRAVRPDLESGRRARTAGRALRPDRGSASLWVLAVGLALVAAGTAGAMVGVARLAKHEARTTADLGALAGAARLLEGDSAACGRATEIVSANGGRLTGCMVDGWTLVVTARVT